MQKSERNMIIGFLAPATLIYLAIFVFPVTRTFLMSFFYVPRVTDGIDKWSFVGLNNYVQLFTTQLFMRSLANVLIIMFLGGAIIMVIALLFANVLHSGARWKSFWRAALYLPNVIPAIALANLWIQYIYSPKFGLFKSIFNTLGLKDLAGISWLSPEYMFQAMFIAYCMGCVGYYMVILLAGLEGIPDDYYECARLEGANGWTILTKISLPLMKSVIRNSIVIWCVGALNFFVWSDIFSSIGSLTMETASPVSYMYQMIFGQKLAISDPSRLNSGVAAGVGVIITILVIFTFATMNILLREEKASDRIEY